MRRNYEWVIMSANGWISGKPSIEKIVKENGGLGSIMVCERDGKKIFVLGAQGGYGEVGQKKSYVKDTGNGYKGEGCCIIENRIDINENGITNAGNGIGVDEKRTLYVFK